MISIYSYSWVGKHRNRSGGGGGFFIRDTINYRIRLDLNDIGIEILTIEISKNKNRPFLIITWCRPPNDPIDTLYKFENHLRLIDNENKECIIVGDVKSDVLANDPTHLALKMDFITKLYQYERLMKILEEVLGIVHL